MFSVKVQRVTISGFGAELHNSAFVVQKQQQRQNDESDSSKITLQKQASDRIWHPPRPQASGNDPDRCHPNTI